jgi:hypothetical protein
MSATPPNPNPENNPGPEIQKPNPFANLDQLALPQNFDSLTASIEFSFIPCRKPGKQAFVRISRRPEHRGQFAMLEIESGYGVEREKFLVMPDLMPALTDLPGLSPQMLVLAVSRPENSPFIWQLRLPNNNLGRNDTWALSALDIARKAEENWLRITANMEMGSYVATIATADWPEPEWPDLSFEQLLERSFGGNVVADLSHPAIKALRGEK